MKKHSSRFLKLVKEVKMNINEISIEELQNLSNYILIDVREDHEWASGHIPDAVHLSKGILERDIETKIPDIEQTLVLYCGGGYRSLISCENLQKMGYKNVYSLEGGYRKWKEKT